MKRLWSNSLFSKVFASYLAIIVLLFTSFYFYASTLVRDFHVARLTRQMDHEAHLLARMVPPALEGPELDAYCRERAAEIGARITVIAANGRVLGDSAESSSAMENHATRPEVMEAFTSGTGSSLRYSGTVGRDLLYYASLDAVGNGPRIIRIAMPLTEIDATIATVRSALLSGLFLACALGLLGAYAFSRHLSRRVKRLADLSQQVARGIFPQRALPDKGRDEVYLLERNLYEMSGKISANMQAVVAEKEKSDSILRCMLEGLLVLDSQGRVLIINDQAKKMFHVPADREVRLASFVELSRHPEMRKILREIIAFDFAQKHYAKEVELEVGRWFRVSAASLNNTGGVSAGTILVFHDISEIKRLETMRSDFVANVSHELRTPLTAIRGYVETLLRARPTDPRDARHFLEVIERHSERMSRLTEDLLTLADLESGNVRMNMQPVGAGPLIQRVLEVFLDRAAKKGLDLAQRVDEDLPEISGDPDRLQQLFINLVDNAVKFTPPGGRVEVAASRVLHAANGSARIEITVDDTGPGIPEKDLPRLTERFYRVDKARSRELGGTGLGLAIVKHIVQAHDGELQIASVVNRGTTVRVLLPAPPLHARPQAILFLCTANSCRSQMAEGFARRLASNRVRIYSAGTSPKGIHPLAVQVMQEAGIDISGQSSKGLDAVRAEQIDLVITLCGEAAESCPVFPGQTEHVHWPIPDPALAAGDEAQMLAVFRLVRDEIQSRVEQLLSPVDISAHG